MPIWGFNSRFGGVNSRFKDLAAVLGLLTAALGVDLAAALGFSLVLRVFFRTE